MRFTLTGSYGDEEMIGEPVEIPQAPGVAFAVHPNTFKDRSDHLKFNVVHIESGLRLSTGATIAEAVANATRTAATLSPEQFAENLSAGNALREHLAKFG